MESKKQQAIFFCPTKNWGGIEKNVRLRAIHFGKKGHPITVVLLKKSFEDRFLGLDNVSITTINRRGGDLNLLVLLNYISIIKKVKPSMVFTALKKDWWLTSLAAFICNVPNKIMYLGNIRKIRKGLKYRLVFKYFKSIVLVNSDVLREYLIKNTPFLSTENVYKINNGIRIPEKTNAILEIAHQLPKETYIVGSAGWLNYRKGFDQLPAIARKLPEEIHIVHVGSGGLDLDEIDLLQSNPDVSKRIHFIGYQKKMDAFFNTIDAFLLCSREEGMANVLLESLGHGIPIVSTKVPGSEELLDNGTYGVLTEIDDIEAMAKGINDLAKKKVVFEPGLLKKRISSDFSHEKMMSKTEKLFFPTDY